MSICFFFCKQKTAYEMRISDWSSDVCSSDLIDTDDRQTSILPVVIQTLQVRHRLLTWRTPARPEIDVDDAAVQPGQRNRIVTERRRAFARRDGQCPGAEPQQQQAERESVGEGKSVSVSVDLGGRRSIKKKSKRNEGTYNNE